MKKLVLFTFLLSFSLNSQVQIGLDINGEMEGDQSGFSLSLSSDGNTVAIGARSNNENGDNSGHVRVYSNQGGMWIQEGADIDGEASDDQSGYSVSLSSNGTIVAIGSPGNDNSTGQVRIYKNISGIWSQINGDIVGNLTNGILGSSLDTSSDGSIVSILTPFNENGPFNAGSVKIYNNIGNNWTQIGDEIIGENQLDAQNWFSSSNTVRLSSDGSIVAIGSSNNRGASPIFNNPIGHVRIYENISNVWTQIGEDIDGELSETIADNSGSCIDLSSDGSIIAIGSPFVIGSTNPGKVRVYKLINDSWLQLGEDIDGELSGTLLNGDRFGNALSLSSDGTILAIGGSQNDGNGMNSGHVRLYKYQSGIWIKLGQDIDGEEEDDLLGFAVSLSSDGSIVAIGAPSNAGNSSNSGYVRVFSIASELAILELVEDITGNSNGINITASQLNNINGVSGAIEGVDYTTALANGAFVDESNPTASEIQAIIDQVNATLSITNADILSFIIYPNPTKNQVTIQLDNNTELKNVTIYNNLGQQVLISKKAIINTSKLASGLYVVEIETNKGKGSKKLIIE